MKTLFLVSTDYMVVCTCLVHLVTKFQSSFSGFIYSFFSLNKSFCLLSRSFVTLGVGLAEKSAKKTKQNKTAGATLLSMNGPTLLVS